MQMAEFHSFLLLINILCVCVCVCERERERERERVTNHIFFIHSFVDGYLGCLLNLAIINNLMLI